MDKIDLSILIPARNEDMLDQTLLDLLRNIRGDTEIIVTLDGWIPEVPLTASDPRITIIYNPQPKGQRAATNQGARIARGKYLMKSDAHVAFDEGFDVKMVTAMEDPSLLKDPFGGEDFKFITMIPVLRNLHAYNWKCANGHTRYQGKKGVCPECGANEVQDILWIPKQSPARFTFTFDKTMHFQYDGAQAKKPESVAQGQFRETMSIQGSCFMLPRDKYFELDICSESFHSWGQQGVEVACKTWLSGGRVLSNLNTWYAHMFRTNNFGGFPYENPESLINENRELSRELFQRNGWPQAVHSFQWLLDRFNPTPYWHGEPTKGIIYYTDNQLADNIAVPIRDNIAKIAKEKNILITSASLKRLEYGDKNIRFPSLKRSYYAMFKQIVAALENSTADIIYFTEHDVLYHPSHFDFTPQEKNVWYYNQNVWFLRLEDGHAMHYDVNQLSGLVVYRETALIHFKERLALVEKMEKELPLHEYNSWIRLMGFEPFTHGRIDWQTKFPYDTFKSAFPNIDIKHGGNLTGQRWKKEQYRNQHLLINWQEEDHRIEGWPWNTELVKLFSK